jgi:lipopolysaccharide biosynthesis protein
MTTLDESHGLVPVDHSVHSVDAAVDNAVDETQILQEEVERLQQRVVDLELTVQEYRNQMSQVLTSASWKLTSPVRATASRYRTAKVKARRAARKMKNRGDGGTGTKVLTAGLFMPPLSALPETSPLRLPLDVNTLRRAPAADGPLHRPDGDPTVLVVAHVHYPELWGDIEDRLVRMPEPFDLICTITEGTAESAIPRIMERHPRARIEVVPNKGRDWAPLVRLANKGLLSGYDAVAKVHTKKSEHRIDGDGWRLALLDGVFESPDQIRKTIDLLKEDRSAGLVVPTGHISCTEHWGSDQGIVEALAYRLPMAFDPDELQFPAGSMFWCRPWLLERLADLDINDDHFEPEAGQYDATTAHALERLIGVYTTVAGMDIVEAMDVSSRLKEYRKNPVARPNIYAFYLPQYHQCPENDEFWGEGFTDWDNVKKAKPLFEGHRQPILPSEEVGLYDLKDPEVLRKQAKMAKDHGIDGFVMHYYWFDGKKVLDTPLNNWLNDPTIDLPLALCWANEPWTRRWDGMQKDVLIPQSYGDDWANRFWDDITPLLRDPRYISVNDAPVLVVYRLGEIPDAQGAIDTWRRRALADGHSALHLLAVIPSRDSAELSDGLRNAVDGLVRFPPGEGVRLDSLATFLLTQERLDGDFMSYHSAAKRTQPAGNAKPTHEGVIPGWDNTPRRGTSAYGFVGAAPVTWRASIQSATVSGSRNRVAVFVNAWNEWAEGASLEPSSRFGAAILASLTDTSSTHVDVGASGTVTGAT